MELWEKKLRSYGKAYGLKADPDRRVETVYKALQSLRECHTEQSISYFEFLFQQAAYVEKRWWAFQGAVLIMLWLFLWKAAENQMQIRLISIFIPLFVILMIPELWKNIRCRSVEVENTSYFTLRQVYSARLLLFAGADLILLSLFMGMSVYSGIFSVKDAILQMGIPFTVTCGICFTVLCSKLAGGEYFAVGMCLFFTGIWTWLTVQEKLYEQLSEKTLALILTGAVVYLGWTVCRVLSSSRTISEVEEVWN